ncbi:CHRD domain-containing protein [Rhodoferax sp.]|uniref:CHRD domain-containing protein n=1 Tax=Rhodoferax sp. TaxID=50421 RepID=UPI00374CF5EA
MLKRSTFTKSAFLAAALALGVAGCGAMKPSNTVTLTASLAAGNEVPPTASTGSGTAEAWLNKDTNLLSWKVTFTGLTGPATAAHFHGPAVAGSNAGVVVPFTGTTSPLEGQATLTPAQAADLLAGKWYANVHTAANKGGEIRGQMTPKM